MPVLQPAELWQQSGRWYDIKDEMFRLKDRHGRDMCLGMTHEEVVAWLAAKEIRSYRELPQVWYQIQTKERDEARPRSGVLRTREFWMKDAYTLDADDAGLDVAYERQKEAYKRIFRRSGRRVSRRGVRRGHDGRRRRARVHGAERGRGGRDRALPGVRLRRQRGARAVAAPATPSPTGPAARWRRRACGPSPRCASCSGSSPPTRSRACSTWVRPGRSSRWSAAISSFTRRSSRGSWAARCARRTPTRFATRSERRSGPWARWTRCGADRGGRGPRARGRTSRARTARASTSAASGRAETSPPGTPICTWPRPGTPAPRAARRSSSSA